MASAAEGEVVGGGGLQLGFISIIRATMPRLPEKHVDIQPAAAFIRHPDFSFDDFPVGHFHCFAPQAASSKSKGNGSFHCIIS